MNEQSKISTTQQQLKQGTLTFQKLEPSDGSQPCKQGFVRFVCISDTHNSTQGLKVPDGDILLHSGDFTRRGLRKQVDHFNKFLGTLPHKHKIVIAGNHDLTFEVQRFHQRLTPQSLPKYSVEDCKQIKASLTNCTYLQDSGVEVQGYYIYGSPWQPQFYNWGFNLERGGKQIKQKWAMIPDKTDILLTHGPPLNAGDLTINNFHCGCLHLLKTIRDRVRPLLHVFGHIHEAQGLWSDGTTLYANACTVNLAYKNSHKPIVIDLPKRV